MSEQPLGDPDPSPVLGDSRRRVLDVLLAADGPVTVRDIADRTGLHPNTARFHLDGLVDAGLAERAVEERSQPGRPRMLYHATATDVPAGQRSYRLLTQMLTTLILDVLPQPEPAAVQAGAAWGRYLADRPPPGQRVDAEDGIARLSTVLADAGFAPEAVRGTDSPVIRLHHCPFREIAQQHRDVVCSLHLGLIQGVLTEVRAPITAERLEPFVEPSLCLAYLSPTTRRPKGRPARTTE